MMKNCMKQILDIQKITKYLNILWKMITIIKIALLQNETKMINFDENVKHN